MKYPTKGYRSRTTARSGAVAAMLLTVLPLFFPASLQAAEELVLGVFPRRPANETRAMFQPLADYLGKALKRPVRLDVSPDFPAFWQALSSGRYQLVHSNPYHYVRAHKEFAHRVILMNEELGQSQLRAALWVRKDSGIESVEDLRGQKIIFGGGRMAMVSYVMTTDMLRQAGLKDGDYLKQFAINPSHAVKALYYRQGLAAGLSRLAEKLTSLQGMVDFSEMRPLLTSPPVAHHPWSVAPTVSAQQASQIRQALLSLRHIPAGKKVLSAAGLTGLRPANDNDYAPHRKIIRRVMGEEYGSS